MNTYSWKIKNLDRILSKDEKSNVITHVHWFFVGTDGVLSGLAYGVKNLTLDEEAPFIEYEDLTEDMAIEWVVNSHSENEINELKTFVDSQIKAQKRPVTGSGLPWVV
jgi:hypothetical protein